MSPHAVFSVNIRGSASSNIAIYKSQRMTTDILYPCSYVHHYNPMHTRPMILARCSYTSQTHHTFHIKKHTVY